MERVPSIFRSNEVPVALGPYWVERADGYTNGAEALVALDM